MPNPRKLTHSRGTSWEITYGIDGQMARRRFATRQQAVDELAKVRVAIARGLGLLPVDAKTTVTQYAEQWLATLQVRPSTRANYSSYLRNHVLPALGRYPLSVLRRSHIATFVAQLVEKGLAPSTVRHCYLIVAMLMRSACYDRLLNASPCYKIKLPPVSGRTLAVLTPEQVHQLLAATPDCDRAVLATAVGTGMRQGETLGLRLPHLNLLRRQLAVEEQAMTPHGGLPYITTDLKTPASRRVIPLPEFVVLELARHLETYGFGVDDLVFANRRGGIWRRGSFNDSVWKPALRRAGLNESFGFHALRHTYASGLIAENIHPRVIQARLGHKSIVETMDTYGHLFPESRQETTAALDRLCGSG
jgi:integrase